MTSLEDRRSEQRRLIRYLPDDMVRTQWSDVNTAGLDKRDAEVRLRTVVDEKLAEIDLLDALREHAERQINTRLRRAVQKSIHQDDPGFAENCYDLVPPPDNRSPVDFDNAGVVLLLRDVIALVLFADRLADDGYVDPRIPSA